MEEKTRQKGQEKSAQIDGSSGRQIILGKYEMGRLLGQGTYAKVYKARNLETQETVAVKVINKSIIKKQDGLIQQIKREISIMRLAKHPNIVELKEVTATRTKIFFVMEYAKGGDLLSRVEEYGKLKEDLARKYFQQLISAVDYCHSRGVCHRDLKLENLLLDEKENLKVSDFGLSALPEQLKNDGLLHTQCGTPAYVAPEVLRKKGYDGSRADLWSCGVILFVLLSGRLPFRSENLMKMYVKIFKAEYQFPHWISKEAKDLVSKLLVVDPGKRLTIPQLVEDPWFRKGLKVQTTCETCSSSNGSCNKGCDLVGKVKNPPPFFNAFEFITAMSSGFDLSGLFESRRMKSFSVFTSKCPAQVILGKLEEVAKELDFGVESSEEEYKVKLQGKEEWRKGKMSVMVEVFEVAPEVTVVELSKCSGDTLEYTKFCEDYVRPAIQDLVWCWQGDG